MSAADTGGNGEPNGWKEWRQHVLLTLKAQSEDLQDIRECYQKIAIDMAQMKVRASLWGGIVGALGGALAIVVSMAAKWFDK